MSIERLVEAREPDVHWRHLWTGSCEARGKKFILHVCRIIEGGQLRLYVFRGHEFIAWIFDPKHDATCINGGEIEAANVQDLISDVMADIYANKHDMY